MQDSKAAKSGATNTESGVESNETDTNNETSVEVNKSAEEYAKRVVELSSENKKRRQREQTLQKELEELKNTLTSLQDGQLSEQGKYKDAYDKTKKELETERGKFKTQVQAFAHRMVTNQLERAALTAGCQPGQVKDLITLAGARGLLNDLEPDDEFNISDEALKQVLENAQQTWPYFFSRQAPTVKTGTPKTSMEKPQGIEAMPLHEKIRKLAELTVKENN